MKLKMGTRGSPLARAQSGWLAEQLKARHPGLAVETVIIRTSGDKFATQPPDEAMKLAGGKGLFVKEIEEALVRGEIDFAVHSAKDLPGDLAAGLVIGAYPEREDPRDAFIGRDGATIESIARGARVASSSLRRQIQLRAARPDLRMVPMRGNVDTRLRKLEAGQCEGLLLAVAGLKRLGRSDVAHQKVPLDLIIPAPGQGSLAVEVRGDSAALKTVAVLDHRETRLAVECERAFLRAFGGGCTTPLGAHARARDGRLEMSAFWAEADGTGARRVSDVCPDPERRERFAEELAERLRSRR